MQGLMMDYPLTLTHFFERTRRLDLENLIMAHPKVLEAAVVAVPHPQWVERPLACVVPKPEFAAGIAAEEILEFLRPQVARWWMPDGVAFSARSRRPASGGSTRRCSVNGSATGGPPRAERRLPAWVSYLIVFVASGCTLVLELVAGRILAPFVGVSIHTWTSIIGVVLAGISIGNYLGGALADRAASGRTLGILVAAGGLTSLAVLPLAGGLGAIAPRSYPLVLRIVLLTTLLFFLPSLLLGMVPPLAIKLALDDLGRVGNVVGRIYAASTAGSLVGTFLTGFVLIAHFGTRAVVLAVGLTLVTLGALAGALARDGARSQAASA